MNVWSPASWQKIQRDIYTAAGVKPSFDAIEAFIDSNDLWDATPEEIVAKCTEESDL
jgi:hypothetical protein